MHIISREPFVDAIRKYSNQATAIESLYSLLKRGDFHSPHELKAVIASLDNFKYKERWWVIDIGGNTLRMIAFIEFRHNRIYVKHIVSHAEYDELCKRYRN